MTRHSRRAERAWAHPPQRMTSRRGRLSGDQTRLASDHAHSTPSRSPRVLPPDLGNLPAEFVVLYDGRCAVCTRAAIWLRLHDRRRQFQCVPSQRPGILGSFDLTRQEADRAVWLIALGTGERLAGSDAILRTFLELDAPWRWIGMLGGTALFRSAARAGYRWFAAHRGWFARWGVTPACDHPDEPCAP